MLGARAGQPVFQEAGQASLVVVPWHMMPIFVAYMAMGRPSATFIEIFLTDENSDYKFIFCYCKDKPISFFIQIIIIDSLRVPNDGTMTHGPAQEVLPKTDPRTGRSYCN